MLKKTFNQMAVAQIISGMTVILCLLIDSIMIGRFLGVDSMAAYGFSNPLLLSFAAIGNMISAGVQVICSKSIGSGDQESTNAAYSVTITLCAIVSAFALLLVLALAGPISQLLGAGNSGPTYDLTKDYLIGFIIGAPGFLAATVLVPFMQLAGQQIRLVMAVIFMTISDVIFDLLNVFVFHGGMFGMGLASSLSYYIACAIGIVYFIRKDCMFKLNFKIVNVKRCKDLLKSGIPTIINMLSLVLLSFTINRILIVISDNVAVASYSIISTVSNICYAFSSGIAAVTLMLAGVYYFEDDKSTLHDLMRLMLRKQIILDIIITAVVVLIAPLLVALFVGDTKEAADMATLGVRLFALSLVPSSINTGIKHFYQGTQRVRLTELLSVLQNFACIAGFSFILSFFFGTTGVWLGYLCGECLVLLLIYIIVIRKNHCRDITVENFALLPSYFGYSDDNSLKQNLYSMADVIEFSEKTSAFCRKHNASDKCCYYTALCVEEICSNIVEYGFEEGKHQSIDACIFFKETELIVRIRDACKPFDPIEYKNMLDNSDPTSHIGIRMIMALAKDIKYSNSLSMNGITFTMDSEAFDDKK